MKKPNINDSKYQRLKGRARLDAYRVDRLQFHGLTDTECRAAAEKLYASIGRYTDHYGRTRFNSN